MSTPLDPSCPARWRAYWRRLAHREAEGAACHEAYQHVRLLADEVERLEGENRGLKSELEAARKTLRGFQERVCRVQVERNQAEEGAG